jgi:hypothetical protein
MIFRVVVSVAVPAYVETLMLKTRRRRLKNWDLCEDPRMRTTLDLLSLCDEAHGVGFEDSVWGIWVCIVRYFMHTNTSTASCSRPLTDEIFRCLPTSSTPMQSASFWLKPWVFAKRLSFPSLPSRHSLFSDASARPSTSEERTLSCPPLDMTLSTRAMREVVAHIAGVYLAHMDASRSACGTRL